MSADEFARENSNQKGLPEGIASLVAGSIIFGFERENEKIRN